MTIRQDIAQQMRAVAKVLMLHKDFANALGAQRMARLLMTGQVTANAGIKELARYDNIATSLVEAANGGYWFNGRQGVPTECGWCGDRLTVAEMQVTEPQPGPDFGLVCDACKEG